MLFILDVVRKCVFYLINWLCQSSFSMFSNYNLVLPCLFDRSCFIPVVSPKWLNQFCFILLSQMYAFYVMLIFIRTNGPSTKRGRNEISIET